MITSENTPYSNPLRNVAFVGRKREVSELAAALEKALSGSGGLVMLVGEPGIGKTRTAQELADIAERRGTSVLWGRCHEQQGMPPYWPWKQAIRSYVQNSDPEDLRSEMGQGANDIAEVVPEINERMPNLQPSPPLDNPEQARFRLFDSITTFIKNASKKQPLMIVLDNLHWADKPSLLLMEFLGQEIEDSHLLVVGTYRDVDLSRQHPLSETLGELTRQRLFHRVALRGLSIEDVRQFILSASGIEPPRDLVELVYSHTEGNPLFMTEVVRMLEQEGKLTPARLGGQGDWNVRIPEGVREVIGRRLNRLSEECNRVLTVASVIGREFDFRPLKILTELKSEDELLEVLDEALEASVIEELAGGAERYQFSHALVRQTLVEELSTSRRIRMHARIGEELEQLYGNDVEAHAEELAYHFAEAEPTLGGLKLVRYSLMAGERALAAYAWEDALEHFERGLAAKEGPAMNADKAALLFGLGRAQAATLEGYRVHEAAVTVRPAFEYYLSAGDVPTALAIAEYPFRLLAANVADDAQFLVEALKLVPSDSHRAGRLLARYGAALTTGLGSFDTAIETLGQALAIAQRENDTPLEQTILTRMAGAHWLMRLNPQESLDTSLRAIELDRRVSQIRLDHDANFWAAAALIAMGNLEGAWPHAAAHLAMTEKRGERFSIAQAFHANEVLAHLIGNWETARDFSDRGLAVDHRDTRLLSNRATLEYELGDFDQGDAYLERLVETMRLSPPRPTLDYSVAPLAIGVAARITGMARQFEIAEAAANAALPSPSAVSFYAQLARTGLALMAVERGDAAVAREQYDALRPLRITLTPANLMCRHRVLGLLAQTMGRIDDAVVHFEDSLAFCRKAGCRPELAWTCHDYAALRLAQDEPDKSIVLLEEALSVSTELGMKPLRERVVDLQQKAGTRRRSPAYPDGLTEREVEVLRLIASGKSNHEIAEELFISQHTVVRHVSNLFAKTGVANRAEAATYANQQGLVRDTTR